MLDPRIGIACTTVDGDPRDLYADEKSSVAKAVPQRRREFAAGRAAAREAMVRIGLDHLSIPSGPDRSPIWPLGVVGSISHTRQICIAVAGLTEEIGGIGIDVEERCSMDQSLWQTVCTPEEHTHVQSQPTSQRGDIVTRLFSAKEAFYKWQYPATKRLLDFQDVQVDLEPGTGTFMVHQAHATQWPDAFDPVRGGIFSHKTWVIAWVLGPLGPPLAGSGHSPS